MRKLIFILLFTVSALANETPAPPAPETPRPSGTLMSETQLFQVVLLKASRKGADDIDGLPKSAEKALADVRDFLPFKHYQLLDSSVFRLAYGMPGAVTVGSYQVKLSYERKENRFSIWWFTVYPDRKRYAATPQPGPARGSGAGIAPIAPEAVKPLISTSFLMDRGETVVVGTSKLNGDEALMVLLTALPGK